MQKRKQPEHPFVIVPKASIPINAKKCGDGKTYKKQANNGCYGRQPRTGLLPVNHQEKTVAKEHEKDKRTKKNNPRHDKRENKKLRKRNERQEKRKCNACFCCEQKKDLHKKTKTKKRTIIAPYHQTTRSSQTTACPRHHLEPQSSNDTLEMHLGQHT